MQELTGAMCEQSKPIKSHPPSPAPLPRRRAGPGYHAAPPIENGGCFGKCAGAHWQAMERARPLWGESIMRAAPFRSSPTRFPYLSAEQSASADIH